MVFVIVCKFSSTQVQDIESQCLSEYKELPLPNTTNKEQNKKNNIEIKKLRIINFRIILYCRYISKVSNYVIYFIKAISSKFILLEPWNEFSSSIQTTCASSSASYNIFGYWHSLSSNVTSARLLKSKDSSLYSNDSRTNIYSSDRELRTINIWCSM
jgi:hypothetical protein